MGVPERPQKKNIEKRMETGLAPVLWRRGSFVGLFADPFVKDSELEGGWLAPSLVDFTQALQVGGSGVKKLSSIAESCNVCAM